MVARRRQDEVLSGGHDNSDISMTEANGSVSTWKNPSEDHKQHENYCTRDDSAIHGRASKLGLDLASFDSCFNGQATAKVRKDLAEARRLAISGTPTFFLGSRRQDGKVDVTVRFDGLRPLSGR